jgi:hypothetical protein
VLRKRYPNLLHDGRLGEHFHHHMFHGFDFDRTMLRIGSMNMLLHGVENPDIRYRDSLAQDHAGVKTKKVDFKCVEHVRLFHVRFPICALQTFCEACWTCKRSRRCAPPMRRLREPLCATPIALAPIALQETFTNRVAATGRQKALQRSCQASSEVLFSSLQHRAFRGEL